MVAGARAAEAVLAEALAALDAHDAGERRRAEAAVARAVAASSAERAACEARFSAASSAAAAASAPAPFRGPAADSRLGERFLDIIALVSANGFALDVQPARYICGLTLREGARRADGSLDRAGFAGGPADMIRRALEAQAPWLGAARAAPREDAWMHGRSFSRTTSLIRAAAQGDELRVRELLAAGAPLRCVNDQRWTALHHASRQGSAQVVAALLEADAAGATVDAQTAKGNTALIKASMRGHENAVRLLLARGARQELQGEDRMTALHCASQEGHAAIVEQLCAAPGAAAAIALRDKDGDTPLALAVEHGGGGERLVAALLAENAAGTAVDAQNDKGSTALTSASVNGHEDAVRLLLARGARQELQTENGDTALHLAAWKGHAAVVEQLCAAPGAAAAVALRTKSGRTPLDLAIFEGGGGERLVAALLAADVADAAVDTQNDGGMTALMWASGDGREGAVRLLLARGARQELQSEDGMTALHCAAWKGHAGVIEQLCAAPGAAAAVALRTSRGTTPLALAVSHGNCSERLVAALLAADAAGATVDAQGSKGQTALIFASFNGNEGAVRLLLARGARQELQNEHDQTSLHCASQEGHAGVVELLCAAPGAAAAIALRDKDGDTPLALAVEHGGGGERLVAALLAVDVAGATVDAQDNNGNSALILASYKGHEGAVRLLLARGARQELLDKNGATALHVAAKKGHAGVVEQLCAATGAAAAIALRNKNGDTPLALAVRYGHAATASVLRAHGAS